MFYTRHTSSCICVGCSLSPESLTAVSSSGLSRLPPSCNSNYLGYIVKRNDYAGIDSGKFKYDCYAKYL
ncbi:hypothetical protein BFI42_10765 [Yersinia pestis subsp. microtus bv. Altaica]|nr:hypothetical protein BFI40_05450 [Yersinia pestis subsp. microtus bv. Altaica]OUY18449.1 hypothetical protein BFI42_10765 [Yersinia pestis subsp. microtus bv. Altaica]OUY89695.1 hypothetical protein BFI44_12070 [Yersinia pestis subsp. microtus bv. Altaica]